VTAVHRWHALYAAPLRHVDVHTIHLPLAWLTALHVVLAQVDVTEYTFKLALLQRKYEQVKISRVIGTSSLHLLLAAVPLGSAQGAATHALGLPWSRLLLQCCQCGYLERKGSFNTQPLAWTGRRHFCAFSSVSA
jgi:hypothetical protein